ncbi:MAG: EAL domain-containing protein [Firmicutes bacterium]|nr:EAL domain-containing protein [Bacillota bacterium]
MAYFNHLKNTLKSILIIFTACIGIGFLIYFNALKILSQTTAASLKEMAQLGAKIVENEIERRLQFLEAISKTNTIKNPNLTLREKAQYLNNNFYTKDFIRITISDLQGNAWTSDDIYINIQDRVHFQKAVAGDEVVSNLLISKVEAKSIVVFAVPIYLNGRIIGTLNGVYGGEELSKITDGFRLGELGNSFIVNKSGEIIAHDDRDLVYRKFNPIQESRRDPSLKKLAGLIERMTQGETGAGNYRFLETDKYLGYAPIKGTDWSLAVAAPKSQIFKDINQLLAFLLGSIGIICGIIIIAHFYVEYLRRRIAKEQQTSGNVIEIANIIMIKYDRQGRIFEFNKFAEIKTGFLKEEVIGEKSIHELIDKEHKNSAVLFDSLTTGACFRKTELALNTKTGGKIYLIGHCNCLNPDTPDRRQYELMGIDITEMVETEKQLRESHEKLAALNEEILTSEEELRANYEELFESQQQLRESEERYSLVVEAAGIGIWAWEAQTKKWFFSSECHKILEILPQSVHEFFQQIQARIHPDDYQAVYRQWKTYQNKKTGHYETEHRILLPNGEVRWVHALIKGVWTMDGKLIRMAGSYLNITKLKEYQHQLQYLAYHDSLTGLPNRLMLQNYWNELSTEHQDVKIALFFIDSDNFKLINDTLGHNFGDRLIMAIGARLRTILGKDQIIFRIGGDEFIICVPGFIETKEVDSFANQILQSFNEPFELENKRIHLTASMGIAIYPDHAVDVIELLKNADIAMFKAKELGKNRYVIYDPSLQTAVDERVRLEKNLRDALAGNEFCLYYQPQVDLKTGKVSGFEALLRWNSTELGMVSPLKFIKITEESGMIVELGEWVLEQSCRFLKKLEQVTGTHFTVAVNVSIIQLMQDDFVDRVFQILNKHQVNHASVELEITESILIESFDTIHAKLKLLRDHQIRIALDDFGKGYSSLNYLCQLPISTLKIDKSFIDNINNPDNDRIITGDIVAIGHKAGLFVIAEGVETREQFEYLKTHQCDKIQGYFYCEPLPEEEIISFLKKNT